MGTKIVVHSNTKRLVQVVCAAIVIAASLTGIKKLSAWWRAPETSSVVVAPSTPSSPSYRASGEVLTGQSSVIDGDTLDIHGVRVRLEGVDAPESSQRCGVKGEDWACGQQAALALSNWLGNRPVSCKPAGTDRYQRMLARCFVGTEDVQTWLVLNGWALAYRQYSNDYVAAEEIAQARKVGLWRSEFVPPWEWRRR